MSYQDFYQQSIDHPEAFWTKEAQRIDWHKPFTQVVDYSRPPFANWFALFSGNQFVGFKSVKHAAKSRLG